MQLISILWMVTKFTKIEKNTLEICPKEEALLLRSHKFKLTLSEVAKTKIKAMPLRLFM